MLGTRLAQEPVVALVFVFKGTGNVNTAAMAKWTKFSSALEIGIIKILVV